MGQGAPGAERGGRSGPGRGRGPPRDPALRTARPGPAEGAAPAPEAAPPAAVEV